MLFQNLVAGVDLTARTHRVAAFAAALAKDLKATLTFVHADPEDAARFHALPAWEVIETALASVRAEAHAQVVAASGDATRGVLVRSGSAEAVLQSEAEARDDAALVIGTGATGPMPDVGVTTTRCLRHVTVPMFIVPTHDGPEPRRVRHVLAPVDFERGSDAGLALAGALAQSLGADLTAVHVVRPPVSLGLLGAREHEALMPGALRDLLRAADAELVRHLRQAGLGHVKTRVIESMRAADGIAALADEVGADLIVLPSHASGGVARFFLGSTSERLVRLSHVPLLVLPPTWLAEQRAR